MATIILAVRINRMATFESICIIMPIVRCAGFYLRCIVSKIFCTERKAGFVCAYNIFSRLASRLFAGR